MRDIQLDIYRALAMIYIICVIHIVYWLGIGDEPIKSLILFEMPVIFFISGASFSLQSKDRDFKTTLISRFKRVVMPYYVYAIIVLVISITCLLIGTTWMGYELPTISFKQVLNMLLCGGVDGFPFNSHMWFIKPYFLLSISFCFQKKIIEKSRIGGGISFSVL